MGIRKTARFIRNKIVHADTSPHVTALSFAIGIVIALGPFPGLHIISGLILLKFWKLNNVVLFSGIFVHNPWTLIPIHTFALALGDLILYQRFATLDKFSQFPWQEFGFFTFFKGEFWMKNGDLFLSILPPFFVGSLVLSAAGGIFAYRSALRFLLRKRRHGRTPNLSAS